ncbi:MAG TPA: ATP-binding protein [Pyrinomonadaceae bacterium]|nr:ATP-binding protein [Pyrinomonadaceae bacterium]
MSRLRFHSDGHSDGHSNGHSGVKAGASLQPGGPVKEMARAAEAGRAGEITRADVLLRAMMNGMREGVIVLDQQMRVLASNPAARSIFRGVPGKLEDKRLSEVTRHPSINNAFRTTLESGERAEVKIEMLNGEQGVFELQVVPLRVVYDDSQRGAIGVFFDITRLEHLERVRQEFFSNVSHELRTPLTAIIAYVETLEDGAMEDQENNQRFLGIIRKNAARMHNLIDDILELSTIEAGNVTIAPAPVHLASLISDIKTALASRAAEHRILVHNGVAAERVVYADPRRLEQMLTNLVDNAIKFNREGGSVRINLEQDAEGARDRISISDTGDGIPAEHLERIFERFYRVDRARSRELGGTGLGLAIVKHLARAHGGEILVQSTPGEGSTFIIELPAAPPNSNPRP